ncbi:MAG: hypothetical protein U0T74_13560 [Chitinophagales bacterium]
MILSFCQKNENFQYIKEDDGKIEYSIKRTILNGSVFVDEKNISPDKDFASRISTDTFRIRKSNWYVKEFGKYQLFLGPESFLKDSLVIQLDLAAKRSDLGFWNDSQTVYPFSYIYRPKKKIFVGNGKSVYVYNSTYYIYGQEADFSSPETIYFDPEIGVVKTFSLTTGEIILKDYPYLDSLKIE